MEIRLLGPLEVRNHGRVVEVAGRRLRLLLAVLALQAGQVVAPERLIDLLWEEAAVPADPANALQALVSRLRRALDSAGEAEERLILRPSGYLLAVEPEQVDAIRFERLCREGHEALAAGQHAQAAATLRAALALWHGPALADFPGEPFAAANATRLEELRLGAIEDRIAAELALGGHVGLVGELETLTAEHPLRERLHALLMRALYAAGRQADALAVYQRVRNALADRAGLDPGPELRQLEAAILAQDPALGVGRVGGVGSVSVGETAAFRGPPRSQPTKLERGGAAAIHSSEMAAEQRPEPSAAPRRGGGNLGARGPLTSFVGREQELVRLLDLLGRSRLVTLTGPGGVGKTRLGVEAARRLALDGAAAGAAGNGADRTSPAVDSVWLVELAGLTDGRLVALAVLDTLGLSERPRVAADGTMRVRSAAGAAERLREALERQRTLLVLDNCEHLAAPVAALVERLLAGCPGVRVLATSREPLRVPGEVRWPVPALPVPPPDLAAAPELDRFASARLFLERAAAAVPGFAVRDGTAAAAVAEICRRLDGLPLAIELAAARVGALPPPELAKRLDDRFRLLTAGSRTALPRQQTLRAVVDWSWELLEEAERAVLRRLSVFAGGCTLDAAEAVCGAPGFAGALPAGEVPAVIARLADKSLVTVGPTPAAPAPWWPGVEALRLPPPPEPDPAGGTTRYSLLDTVRAYAAERLADAGEAEATARAHAQWAVKLAEAAESKLTGSDQLAWFARLSAELDNLRAAWRFMLRHGEAGPALRLLGALGFWLLMAGHREEAIAAIKEALALPGPVPDRPRAMALYVLCLGDEALVTEPDALRRTAKESQAAMERAATTPAEAAFARTVSATLSFFFVGGAGEAERALDEALGELERDGAAAWLGSWPSGWPVAIMRQLRGFARAMRGNLAGAVEDGEVSLAHFRQVGDRWGMTQALELLGMMDSIRGNYQRAEATIREALRCAWELRVPTEVAVQLSRLAYLAVAQNDLDRAEPLLQHALAASEEFGMGPVTAFARAGLALVAQRGGEIERARDQQDQAVALWRRHGSRSPVGPLLLGWLGTVSELRGDLEQATAFYAELLSWARQHGDSPSAAIGALARLAGVAAAQGDHGRAAQLLGAAAAGHRRVGLPLAPGEQVDVDRVAALARQALGEEAFVEAFARGERLPPAEAVALAEQFLA
jgi:predicted ATPase/DNA-binding SARP family transcriptional activator